MGMADVDVSPEMIDKVVKNYKAALLALGD